VRDLRHVVDELVAVERRCCPFFDLGWERTNGACRSLFEP